MPVFQLNRQPFFPDPDLAEENGLLAIGGDLRPERLIAAYRQGIFPWYSKGDPLLWWFTSPRLVLFPEEFHTPRRLARKIRQHPFTIRFDTAFEKVITACAGSRTRHGEETWILPEMKEAYLSLHQLGYAHSVECWQDDRLAGGLYGVQMDRVFFGESMFTVISDASKIALAALVDRCLDKGVKMIDCQMTTQHLVNFGARELLKKDFITNIAEWIQSTEPEGKWTYDKNN